jgi:hypothetical protein
MRRENTVTMDNKLRKILTDCIGDIETGALDMEGCLQRHPDRAAELRPHLELWSGLNAAAKAQPNFGSQQRGKHQLLSALADMERGQDKGRMIPALAKVAVVMVAAALLIGGAAGASAALGGPDVADEVLSGIGLSNASDRGKACASENAFQGSDNAQDGAANAEAANATGDCHGPNGAGNGKGGIKPNASKDTKDAGRGANNASETGTQNANENAFKDPKSGGQGVDGDDE